MAQVKELSPVLGIGEQRRSLINKAIKEYKKEPLTPELINETWQALWAAWGGKISHAFDIPACDRTAEELVQLQRKNRAILLLPDEIYTKEGLIMLHKIFPKMCSRSILLPERASFTESNKGGCIDIEMNIKTPNRNTTEDELSKLFFSQGRSGQSEADYIIGTEFSNLLTGQYFDVSTDSRLLGSFRKGRVVCATYIKCSLSGYYINSDHGLYPISYGPKLGGRSRGIKKT